MINQVFDATGESIFSTVTRLAREYDAINLGQGFPNFRPPEPLLEELQQARSASFDQHQYAPSPGIFELKQELMKLYRDLYGFNYDPEKEVTITTGATEGLASALYGLLNPGDEVIVFEPVYDLYAPVSKRAGAEVVSIPLEEPEFNLPIKRLKRVVSKDTDLIILNNPHNPTGRVFRDEELKEVVNVAEAHDAVILADEVYEHLFFEGKRAYTPLASFDGARERTIWLGSAGKTFNATGWKIGWALAPADLTRSIRSSHQFTTFCTATPLQHAVARFMGESDMRAYLDHYRKEYGRRKELLIEGLRQSPFEIVPSEGTYFTVVKVPDSLMDKYDADTDLEFVKSLVKQTG
ncbi:MAG: pyridoxal phosphate-dependent aminotransferase, partial [bacterium]